MIEEVLGVDVEPEHLPELARNDRECDPVDVPEQDGLAEEVGMKPSLSIPPRKRTAPIVSASAAARAA